MRFKGDQNMPGVLIIREGGKTTVQHFGKVSLSTGNAEKRKLLEAETKKLITLQLRANETRQLLRKQQMEIAAVEESIKQLRDELETDSDVEMMDKPSASSSPPLLGSSSPPGVGGHLSAAQSSSLSTREVLLPPMDFDKAKKVATTAEDDEISTTAGGLTLVEDDLTTVGVMSIEKADDDDDDASMRSADGSDDSDKVTEMTGVSRLSNSTASNMKSAGRKASRRAKFLEHAKRKCEESGREFKAVDQESYREEQRKKMLILKAPAPQNKSTQDLIADAKNQQDRNKMTVEEKIKCTFAIDDYFRPKFVLKPIDSKYYYDCHNRYVVTKTDPQGWKGFFCTLCQKFADELHVSSSLHVNRLLEMSAADEMLGCCSSLRRWEPVPGLQGGLTKLRFTEFWGSNVENMILLVRDRIAKGVEIQVAYSKKGRLMLGKKDNLNFGLCCVSYPGQGKYSDVLDRAVRWEDLQDAPMTEGFDQLISEKNHDQQGLLDDCGKKGGERKYMDGYSMQGRGWWPAVIVSWDGEHLCFGTFDRRTYYELQNKGRLRVWVICWYQLCDGTIIMEAWPIFLVRPWSRM